MTPILCTATELWVCTRFIFHSFLIFFSYFFFAGTPLILMAAQLWACTRLFFLFSFFPFFFVWGYFLEGRHNPRWYSELLRNLRFYCFREILSSKIVSRPDRQLVCPAIAPVSCPPVRGAVSSVHTGHHLCVFPHTAVSSDQCSPHIQSLTYPLICQAQFMRKWGPRGEGERKRNATKFEKRPTKNQWRTSAKMSRNPNAEMQVYFSTNSTL